MSARVSILGATGYGGGELLRILLRHPAVTIARATSRSAAGALVSTVHRNLFDVTDLCFSSPTFDELSAESDVIIGALPHGASAEVLAPFIRAGVPVVDLSGDYRLRDIGDYRTWYQREHPHPELIGKAVYGCPELNRDAIRGARLVASPGCFATAMNLALLPAARAGLLGDHADVVAMTGSSGSGAEAKAGTHHPIRSATLRPYKVLAHQHVPEVVQLTGDAGGRLKALHMTPVSAPLVRGILAVTTTDTTREVTTEEVAALYTETYADAPFVKVVSDREPECAAIGATNFAEVRARATADGRLHVVTAIDNLLKGGAGQAVQCLNLMLGFEETTGLDWPGTWP
jgi:N-acetyl-gamma-glutamyl-phosphate reductase